MADPKLKCPAEDPVARVAPEEYQCPKCGTTVEIWTDESKRWCPSCGAEVVKDEAQPVTK